jgi:phosphoglycerate dehydrogenase-like enzyme
MRVAILDDYAGMVRALPHWSRLDGRASIASFTDTLADDDALARRLAAFDVAVAIRERTRFTASLLQRLPALRLLAFGGRFTGQADLAAATAAGVLVTDTEGSGVSAVEHTMALMLAIVRRIPQEDRAMRDGRWQTPPLGVEMSGKTLGIVGLGRIGTRIAAFGRLLGMRVLATGLSLNDGRAVAAGATRVTLDTLMAESDVVSLHLRLSDKTRGIVGARHLALMKSTAYLVNTARGPLVDESALVAALRERRIAGAALDVYDVEPLPADHALLGLDNVVLTPHVGFVTREAYDLFFAGVVDAIEALLAGKTPSRALNPEATAKGR